MLVKRGGQTLLEARAKAQPGENVVTSDYYTQLPQIHMTADATAHPLQPETPTEVTLDGNDVAKLVECAVRHPAPNMRFAVLAAIWNHTDSFRQIFRFGLDASPDFSEIRKIVAEELDRCSSKPGSAALNEVKPVVETLLPRMPLPAHLRGRQRQ